MTIELFKTLSLGLFSFTTTNLDDFLLLIVLFSMEGIPVQKVFIGQFLGMLGILSFSYVASSAGLFFLPPHWIGILGLVPLFIGLKELYQRHFPMMRGKTSIRNPKTPSILKNNSSKIGIFTITMMTLANGGDNIAVYSGFFAEKTEPEVVLLAILSLFLTFIWCIGAFAISSQEKWRKIIDLLNTSITPYALIIIGLSILFKLI